ncbi:MAG: efflux RND transporter permease subunit [Candidatus Hydrogenedentes bacterium]|nr:efflux RND transporter permease subunit [Candidatus Hydrogenedentota bacterium]
MSDPSVVPEAKHYSLPIRRPVTMAMIFVSTLVFGWKSFQDLPINLMPDISYPTLTVRTEYEGAAPEDIEKLVTRPLEETLSIVSGLVEVSSVSSPGLSEIVMEFNWGTDMNLAQQDVRDRLDLFDPPREVTEKPVILRYDPTLDPVFRVGLVGRDLSGIQDPKQRAIENERQLTEIREAAERYVKGDLEAESGIAQVSVKGGREEEVKVEIDADRLKSLGLSVELVAEQLRQQNINLSGGSLREGKTEYLVRTRNEWESLQDIESSILSTPTGKQIRLKEIGNVTIGKTEQKSVVRINGVEAVELQIYKWGDANTVRVCNTVKDLFGFPREKNMLERITEWMNKPPSDSNLPPELAAIQFAQQMRQKRTLLEKLPKEVTAHAISDQSRFIISAIREVQSSAVSGGFLAIIVLYFFLRELKSTMIIGLSIPLSVVATFIPMFVQNMTLNIMSLGGLAMGVGMLVDNSIVVLESIFRCGEEGDGVVDAADRGAREVAGAVTASTLTSVAVFLPIAFVQGVAGQLFQDHALVVTYSLMASLFVALYLTPMIASRSKPTLLRENNVIWVTNAYRRTCAETGQSGLSALIMMVPYSALGVAEWLLQQAKDNYGPLATWVFGSGGGIGVAVRMVVAIVPLILVTLLFVIQCLLGFAQQFFSTLLLFVSIIVVGTSWLVGKVFHFVFWIPLELFNRGFDLMRGSYTVFMRRALRFSPAVLAIVAILAVHSASLVPTMGRELIPPMKQGEFGIQLITPAGTRLEETARRANEIEQLAMAIPEIGSVSVEIGQEDTSTSADRGENVAEFSLTLKNPKEDVARQDEITERLRSQVNARLLASDKAVFTLPSLFSFKTAVELQIRGDDYRELKRIGDEVVNSIRDVAGIKDLELNMREGYPEIIIQMDRDLLAAKGITPETVAMRLRAELQGDLPTEFSRRGEKIKVRVQADQNLLNSVDDLRKLAVNEGLPPIPLEAVASIQVQPGPSEIRRIDQRQVAVVTGNVEGRDLGAVMDDVIARTQKVAMPSDYQIIAGGQNRELQVSLQSLEFALWLAVFLVYAVMACQFESIRDPALVMVSVPLGSIGVIYTLVAMHVDLSILVYIGAICLAGIVVNNAIVLVDYTNLLMSRGMERIEAIVEAGRVRMRPILMTTLTTVLGLLPMSMASGEGDEIRRPMAITIIAGLTCSTILTLVIIPMVFYLFGSRKRSTIA